MKATAGRAADGAGRAKADTPRAGALRPPGPERRHAVPLDETDLRVLRAMQDHPDESVEGIGKAAGLSHTPCWRRLKRLEALGVIRGRLPDLDRRKLGISAVVLTLVKLNRNDENALDRFETEIQDIPNVVECYSITGEYDYCLKIVAADMDEFEYLLKHSLSNLSFVADVNSSVALREVKVSRKLPI